MRTAGRITVDAAATWLPSGGLATVDALAEGRLTEHDAAASGYRWLPIGAEAAPDMAARAAERALAAAGRAPVQLDLLVHAWTYHQGHDFWSPAHYVAHRIGAHRAVPVGVQQMCNGGGVAVEAAAARLLADDSAGVALVTAADSFREDGFDRWRGDYGVLYGDGAAAAVLSRDAPGPAGLELLAVRTVAAPALEAMHRGDRPFSAAAREHGRIIDVRATKKAFLATVPKESFTATVADAVGEVLDAALTEADLAPDDPRLRCVLLPRLGRGARESIYQPAIAARTPAACVDLGPDTGHLGAGDALANLAALTAGGLLLPGERAAVLSAGAGFTWTCLVVAAPPADPPGPAPARTARSGEVLP